MNKLTQSLEQRQKLSPQQILETVLLQMNGIDLEQKILGTNFGMATLKNPPALESSIFTAMMMSIVPAHLLRSVGGGYDNESVATTAMVSLTFIFVILDFGTPLVHVNLLKQYDSVSN